jgi:23S rRNA G2069 N7-methylase RlmK/C1962 C5-methylase RlmI
VRRSILRVRGDVAARLRLGHPWVFRESVDRGPPAPSGTEVEVRDEAGEFLARGLFDADSPVCGTSSEPCPRKTRFVQPIH